jgi:hypothetical protein
MRKALSVAGLGLAVPAGAAADTRWEIACPSSASAEPLTRRLFTTDARIPGARGGDREPWVQIGRLGAPFFRRDFAKLALAGTVGYGADADNLFLNNGVECMQDWMESGLRRGIWCSRGGAERMPLAAATRNPHCDDYFLYDALKRRCPSGPETTPGRLRQIGEQILAQWPARTVADR